MLTVSEATPQSPVKDKSPWRKSNLNVANTSEETEHDVRRLRRLKSRGAIDTTSTPPSLQVLRSTLPFQTDKSILSKWPDIP